MLTLRRRIILLTLAAAAIAAATPGSLGSLGSLFDASAGRVHAQAGSPARPTSPPRRVLFIGNSYTYVNNLPEMLRTMAAARGITLDVGMATTGGWKLSDHWTTANSDAHRLLRDRKWDVVVLQEQSVFGSTQVVGNVQRVGPDDQFQRYAKLWQEEIRSAGMTPAFYLTWARRGAPEDQAVLDRAYVSAARAAKGILVPVGAAWQGTRQHHAGIELFQSDGSHPSPAGTYLAACTFFAAFFDRSPVGLPATVAGAAIDQETARPSANQRETLVNLSPSDAAALQREAWAAWQHVKARP
jgi:hypothetical protein